jgi:hypothetical protein
LPHQRLEGAVSHLQNDRERDVGGARVPAAGRLLHSFRPIVANLSGKAGK